MQKSGVNPVLPNYPLSSYDKTYPLQIAPKFEGIQDAKPPALEENPSEAIDEVP